jgi:hypothetical protein
VSCFLQTAAGGLDVSTGRLQIVTDLPTICAQKLNNLYKFFLGEYFLDTRLGVPYFKYIFVRNPDLGIVREILVAVAKTVPEVDSIVSVNIVYDSGKRTASAVLQVQLNDGTILTGGPGVPFIVKLST